MSSRAKRLLGIGCGLGLAGVVIVFLVVIPLKTQLTYAPLFASKETLLNQTKRGVVLVDRNGRSFFSFFNGRTLAPVPLAQFPTSVKQAVIAMEDRQFYSHSGVSLRGIARSAWWDLQQHDATFGGSTITQQLVKNTLLTPRKSLLRKYQEIILSMAIESKYSKDDILEMYLNSAYFGRGAFGMSAAAQTYFGIETSELSVAQTSYLVSLLPSPSFLSENAVAGQARWQLVMSTLREQNIITPAQYEVAHHTRLSFRPFQNETPQLAPHFALMVKQELVTAYGEDELARSGLTVQTSIDLDWQQTAQQVVSTQVAALGAHRVQNGGAVVLNPHTGEILAMVGSKDWNAPGYGQVNMALAARQPGSSFKPIVYATAFQNRVLTPATTLHDQPTTFGTDYRPKDYDGHFRGPVLVRRALANSLNIPAVETMQATGVAPVTALAQKMGLSTIVNTGEYNLSLALGAGEVRLLDLTDAYATFANAGSYNKPVSILGIKDRNNTTVFAFKPQPTAIIDPAVAFQISSILSDNHARQEVFGHALTINRPAAVKTGTTQNYRDAWTLGYTPDLAIGVWVGNNDNTPMDRVAGALGAAPIWRHLMESYTAGMPLSTFAPPANVTSVFICPWSGLVATSHYGGSYADYFLPGTEPTRACTPPQPSPIEIPNSPLPTAAPITKSPGQSRLPAPG